ncbi:MAG: hypothetical protein ABR535_09975 [Pyrinomonadaceae bacterium]
MINEQQFRTICKDTVRDKAKIIKNNPIGSDDEILLWMLLGILSSFLSLQENEVPRFSGRPDATTYRKAILFILQNRRDTDFDVEPFIDHMLEQR